MIFYTKTCMNVCNLWERNYTSLFNTGDAQREERWEFPLEAIQEIVVNMIVHRDYTSPSESSIKIFKDRIEFLIRSRR